MLLQAVEVPSAGQLVLLGISAGLLIIGGAVSLMRIWRPREALRIAAKACMYSGLGGAVAVIIWNSSTGGGWQPINDNFKSLLWLAVLLGLFVVYMQRFRPIPGLDWFLMPVVTLLLIGAGVFGRLDYRSYQPMVSDVWLWVHRVTAYGGAMLFAIAAAGGAMYVINARRLRNKSAGPKLGSLERLERLMMVSVTLGFALLTVGLVTGFGRMFDYERPPYPKMLLSTLAWLVYAVVMHAPINPRFRGRRAAMLSVFGFVLIVGTLVAVQFGSGGHG